MRDYGARKPTMLQGSNHISFVSEGSAFRVTTNAPISYVVSGSGFVLTRPLTFILHADETLPDAADRIGADFEDRTREYWLGWVRTLNVPFDWQDAVIRAAITLHLCSFAETGAIVAALTTSIPESAEFRAQLGLSLSAGFATRISPFRRSTASARAARWSGSSNISPMSSRWSASRL